VTTINQQQRFESIYRSQPPDGTPGRRAQDGTSGKPQPVLIETGPWAGAIIGTVLDAGCGTGDNASCIWPAGGYTVTGLDAAPLRHCTRPHQGLPNSA